MSEYQVNDHSWSIIIFSSHAFDAFKIYLIVCGKTDNAYRNVKFRESLSQKSPSFFREIDGLSRNILKTILNLLIDRSSTTKPDCRFLPFILDLTVKDLSTRDEQRLI